jgi:hypothetical protein
MALRDLSSQQMLNITGAWLDAGRDRPLLQALSRVAPLLPDIQEAHDAVQTSHRRDANVSTELIDIQDQQAELDQIHDRKVRGIHNVLTGFAELSNTPEDAGAYLEIHEQLFPDGLKFITGSYGDQAGEVTFARERLTSESKAVLKAMPTPSGSLMKAVDAWFTAGDDLGALEARRAKLEAELAQKKSAGVQGGQLRARNRWIGVVRAVMQMLELEKPDVESERHLLAPLERALKKADRRAVGNDEGDEQDELASPEARVTGASPQKTP